MTDGCCLDFVRRAVAHICRSAGWNCISQSAHDTLTDVLLLYVENSARIAQTCSRHSSRTMPTLDDVAFSIRHIGASLSELLSQPEDLPAHDIQTVWDKLPASYLTHSLVESEQAGISLDMVERQPSENVKDSTSVIYSNEANFSYEGAESHSVSGHGSHLQVLAAFNPEVNVNDISPVDNIEMKPIDHDLVEVSDPWEWPSVVKAIDLTHKASTSASKQLLVQSDKKLPKPEPTAESPVPVRSSTFSSENIKTEERNSTEKTVAPMLVHTTDDQRVIFSNRDQQNQTAVAQLDHHKIKSHFGNDAQAQTQERVVGGSKAALFKIPKLKLKVGAHGESPSDSGQMSHLAVELDPKHQKIKKKKRKAKDIDKESRKSGLSKLPKKAKHKDKAKQATLPLQPEKLAINTTGIVASAAAHHAEIPSSVPSQPTVVSQTLPFEQHQAQLAAMQSEYHCPVCRMSDIDGVPWITCDRCNNDIWYHLFCVGLAHEPLVDEKWFCPKCQKKINKQARQQSKQSHIM